ncbi:MAG: hypothetical protein ACQSGP_13860 [Frankia sp.]
MIKRRGHPYYAAPTPKRSTGHRRGTSDGMIYLIEQRGGAHQTTRDPSARPTTGNATSKQTRHPDCGRKAHQQQRTASNAAFPYRPARIGSATLNTNVTVLENSRRPRAARNPPISVWSDPAGAALQNDVDLIVRSADGQERHGNMGTSKNFDRQNNVEQMFWVNMPPGKAKIVIRAFRITRFPQPYAYAWRIN